MPAEPGEAPPAKGLIAPLVKAYAMLGYSVGFLSAAEGKALDEARTAPPPGFTVAGDEPQSALIDAAGVAVGVVFFPELGKNKNPSENMIAAVAKEAGKLRSKAKLVIGLSPWGYEAERYYLERGKPAVDLLLGGGPGIGLTPRPDASGKTLWMRAFSNGKTLDSLDLLAWPGGADFKWADKGNYAFQILTLGEDIPAKPEMDALFAPFASLMKEEKSK